MEGKVIINQSLTASDLANGSFRTLINGRIMYLFGFIYCIMLLNAIFALTNPLGLQENSNPPYTGLIVATLLPFIFFIAIRQQAVSAVKRRERYYKNISFTITPDYVISEGEGYSNTYRWEELVKVKETKRWYLIYISKQQALIIDKSQMDNWQKEALDEILVSKRSKMKVSLK